HTHTHTHTDLCVPTHRDKNTHAQPHPMHIFPLHSDIYTVQWHPHLTHPPTYLHLNTHTHIHTHTHTNTYACVATSCTHIHTAIRFHKVVNGAILSKHMYRVPFH